jgi:hypothetical protein
MVRKGVPIKHVGRAEGIEDGDEKQNEDREKKGFEFRGYFWDFRFLGVKRNRSDQGYAEGDQSRDSRRNKLP